MKLSSITIAKNEEKNIGRCLDSMKGIIDDIVVIVDNTTTDKTIEICNSYQNVNCESVEWKGYGDTKNYALSKTQNEWVLWIDADEEITQELYEELKDFKKSEPKYNSFYVARRAFFLGKWIKHSGWYPSRVIRLFNKNYASFNDKSVHENITVRGQSGKLNYDLNHYTDPDIEHYFRKFNTYTSLAAKDLFNAGKQAGLKDILIRPLFLFTKMYIFRLGFLDGFRGFILALFSSFYVFTKYSKLWELNKLKKD